MDNVEEAFESVLDYKQFSLRINESDIERTPDILRSIPDSLVLQMQRSLAKVRTFSCHDVWTAAGVPYISILVILITRSLYRLIPRCGSASHGPEVPCTGPPCLVSTMKT
jgi:hypothetical protein